VFFIYVGWELYSTIEQNRKIENQIDIEYPRLLIHDSLNFTLESKYYPENWRGAKDIQCVTFENGHKYTIWIYTNLTSKDVFFGDIIQKGDRIIKKAGSDTLEVISNKRKYMFLINKNLE
jgi:hypothetical protein